MPKTKSICFATLFMLLSAVATISIGYTNFVQAEIKEDIVDLKYSNEIDQAKISDVQISNARIEGKLDILLDNINYEILKSPTE